MIVKTAKGKKDFRALWMDGGIVKAIDQRILPNQFKIVSIRSVKEMANAISDMTIRGAPSIGAAGAYGMALAWLKKQDLTKASTSLIRTRPTAHDLSYAVNLMLNKCDEDLVKVADQYADDIVSMCRKIGENGSKLIKDG
ncbi:MAG: S-methyl-5-thioribose-1-phosphate isomerase, partial [Candidatus Thermoplasmatota archaeon]|nr:S-methyl-5-thioribose-1-phosphate isomerase [Candidatus Thermoplasmatota archaeon]